MAERLILGEGYTYSTDSRATGLNNNVLAVGGSGSGKTWSIAEPRILETTDSSLICTVTKRRLVKKYSGLMRSRGYKVIDLDFSRPAQSPWWYDPIKYVKTPEDVTHLAREIVMAGHGGAYHADPYWDDAATSLLAAEIGYVMAGAKHTGIDPSFVSVLWMHGRLEISSAQRQFGDAIETTLDKDFEAMPSGLCGGFDTLADSCWKSFRSLGRRTAGCVYSTLNVALDTLFSSTVQSMLMNLRKVDFTKLAAQKTAVFITSSAVNPALHRLVDLFYAQAFKCLFEFAENRPDGMLPIPVHVICDDFATGGRIMNFPEYISIFREKGISVTLLLQSESQLASMYGDDSATTIINNCDSYVYLGSMDIRTARDVSARANLLLEDVLSMPVGKEIIFRRGQRPIQTKRYDIQADPRWIEITERREKLPAPQRA